MVDYVNQDHGLLTCQHNFSAEDHGKDLHDTAGGVCIDILLAHLFVLHSEMFTSLFHLSLHLGGDKTWASSASIHGRVIDTAYDLYLYLKESHSEVNHTYHETLHHIDKREYYYFPQATFISSHHKKPKKLSQVKPYYFFCIETLWCSTETVIPKETTLPLS